MKNTFFTILLIFPLLAFSQILWDDFEENRIGYYEFVHGGMTERFENPNPSSSTNNSELCAQYVRNPGEMYDVIVLVANGSFTNLEDYLNGSKTMKVDVFSPGPGIPLQITLEDSSVAGATNYPDGRHSIYTATTTVTNEWETIEFIFDSRPDNSVLDANVTSLILLFDIGSNSDDTYYFDNVYGPEFNNQCASINSNPSINLADWDCHWNIGVCPSNTPCSSYDYISGWLNQAYNPDNSSINTSKYCGSYTRNPDGNGEDVFIMYFKNGALDLSTNKYFNFQIYGPPRPIYVSFQDNAGNEVVPFNSNVSSLNTWEQFSVDLSSGLGQDIVRAVFFIDQSVINWDEYLIDDIHMSSIALENKNISSSKLIDIYPNPVTDNLNCYFENNNEVNANIINVTGKILFSKNIKPGHNVIGINDLTSGFYLLEIKINDITYFHKFQKID